MMDRETIDKLWQKAFFEAKEGLARYHFAKLVAEHEREACAKVVKETPWSNWFQSDCAAAIRARGEHGE